MLPWAVAVAFPELWPIIGVCLIVWAATMLFYQPLVQLLSQLPVVGGWVASTVASTIGRLVAWAVAWAEGIVSPIIGAISAPAQWLATFLGDVGMTFDAIAYQLGLVAGAAAGSLGAAADSLYRLWLAVSNLSSWVAAAEGIARSAVAAIDEIRAVGLPAAIAEAESYAVAVANGLYANWIAPLQGALAAAEAGLSASIAAVAATAAADVVAVRGWAEGAISDAVAVVRAEVGAIGSQLGLRLDGLEGTLGDLLATLSPLLALQLARAFPALVERIDTMERDCVAPGCAVIRPQLDALSDLLGGTSLALVLAFVEGAISDPRGTARTTAGDARGLAGAANATLGGLAGIRL